MMPYYGGTMCKNYLHLCSHLYRTNFRVWNCFHLAFLCHSFPLFHSWSQALVLYFRGASKTWLQEPNYLQHWWLIIIYNYHHHLIFLVCMIKEMRTATLSRLLNSFMYHLFILFLSTTHICSRWYVIYHYNQIVQIRVTHTGFCFCFPLIMTTWTQQHV